jgi:hypothetical protein
VIRTVLVLPSPPALLAPRSAADPVADLRKACVTAVSALPANHPVVVLAAPVSEANAARGITEPLGHRVAAHLLGDISFERQLALPYTAAALLELTAPTTLVVMADGTARRGEKAPGHLHPDAVSFDERLEAALRSGDAETLAALDPEVGEELWCEGVPGLRVLGEVARGRELVAYVSHAEAPYGVAWWVARWDLTD